MDRKEHQSKLGYLQLLDDLLLLVDKDGPLVRGDIHIVCVGLHFQGHEQKGVLVKVVLPINFVDCLCKLLFY